MGFRKAFCLIPVCNKCGEDVGRESDCLTHYDTEFEAIDGSISYDEARLIDGEIYCSECWHFDDDGEVVANE